MISRVARQDPGGGGGNVNEHCSSQDSSHTYSDYYPEKTAEARQRSYSASLHTFTQTLWIQTRRELELQSLSPHNPEGRDHKLIPPPQSPNSTNTRNSSRDPSNGYQGDGYDDSCYSTSSSSSSPSKRTKRFRKMASEPYLKPSHKSIDNSNSSSGGVQVNGSNSGHRGGGKKRDRISRNKPSWMGHKKQSSSLGEGIEHIPSNNNHKFGSWGKRKRATGEGKGQGHRRNGSGSGSGGLLSSLGRNNKSNSNIKSTRSCYDDGDSTGGHSKNDLGIQGMTSVAIDDNTTQDQEEESLTTRTRSLSLGGEIARRQREKESLDVRS